MKTLLFYVSIFTVLVLWVILVSKPLNKQSTVLQCPADHTNIWRKVTMVIKDDNVNYFTYNNHLFIHNAVKCEECLK